MTRAKELLAATAGFAALALVLLAPLLRGDLHFFPLHPERALPWRADATPERIAEHRARENAELSDKLFLIDPGTRLVVESWRRGELPAWSPSIVGGVAFLGQALYGGAYPPNLLLLWIEPLELAFAVALAFHVVVAGLGVHVLARRLGLPPAAAALAGLCFAAGGSAVVLYHLPMRFYAIAWIPWLLVAVHAFTDRPTLARACAVAIPIALVVLSGFPQPGLYGIAGAGLFGAVRLVARRRAASLGPLLALGAAFGLGGALASIQILPVQEAIPRSLSRAHGVAQQIEESGTRFMLAGYFVPGAFQDPREPWSQDPLRNPLWTGLYCATKPDPADPARLAECGLAARPSLTETCCYLGALGLVLAVAAIAGRPGRGATSLALVLLLALAACWAYALGDRFVVSAASFLPWMDVGEVRRIVATIGLLGALLAACGAARLLAPPERGARRFALGVAAGLALALLGLGLAVSWAEPDGFARWLRERQVARYGAERVDALQPPASAADRAAIHGFVRGRLYSASAWFGAAFVVLLAVHALLARGRRRVAAAALIAAVAADLLVLHFRVNPFVPSERFLAPDPLLEPLAAARSGGRVHRFAPDYVAMGDDAIEKLVLPPDLGAAFGIEDAEGYLVMMPTRYARYLRALEPPHAGVDPVVTVAALPLRSPAALRSPLLDGLAVKHVLARHDLLAALREPGANGDGDDGGFALVAQRGEARVYENREALPFALVVAEACFLPPAPADDAIAVPTDSDPASTARGEADDEQRRRLHEAALAALATRPELLRRRAFLEAAPAADLAADWTADAVRLELASDAQPVELARFTARGEPARVVGIERAPQRTTVRLDGGGAGVLLLIDGFDPGWSARIDGAPAPVVPANVAFRAVLLPPGAREVVLEYRPRAVRAGAWISGGALAALVTLAAAGLLARRRPTPLSAERAPRS